MEIDVTHMVEQADGLSCRVRALSTGKTPARSHGITRLSMGANRHC